MQPSGLTHQQKLVLDAIASKKYFSQFTFGGGTALSSFYLNHRFSEDLDFFNEQEFDSQQLAIILSSLKKDLKIAKIDFRQSFNRFSFFLHFPNKEVLKLEFDYYPFPPIEKGKLYKNMRVDSLIDIAVNKLFTI